MTVASRMPRVTAEVEIAAGLWLDLTDRLDMVPAVKINRGRGDEFSTSQPGRLACAVDNTDGATPPEVLAPGRRIRIRSRELGVAANLLGNGDFAAGIAQWWAGVFFGAPVATAWVAAPAPALNAAGKCLSIEVPASQMVLASFGLSSPLVAGRAYEATFVVRAPAGLTVGVGQVLLGANTTATATGGWQLLRFRWTVPGTGDPGLWAWFSDGAALSTAHIALARIDEVQTTGATVTDVSTLTAPQILASVGYTNDALAVAARARFTGYVEESSMSWQGDYCQTQLTATDRLARLGRDQLRSCVEEELLAGAPVAYWTLGEPQNSLSAAESSGVAGGSSLTPVKVGSGGTLTWGSATGNGNDGLPAPTFTPVAGKGFYLEGTTPNPGNYDTTLHAAYSGVATGGGTIASLRDAWSSQVTLSHDAAGHVVATESRAFLGTLAQVTSPATYIDGRTHSAMAVTTLGAASNTLTLVVDGVSVGSAAYTWSGAGWSWTPSYDRVHVGGAKGAPLLTGSVQHVAVYGSDASGVAGPARQAMLTGFAGEPSDARAARIARWAGITDGAFEVGGTTAMARCDTAGKSPLSILQEVEASEQGILFVDGEGILTLLARSHWWSAATQAPVSVAADQLEDQFTLVESLQGMVNDVTANRPQPLTSIRLQDSDSISAYGSYPSSVTLPVLSDQTVLELLTSILTARSTPQLRTPALVLDAFTDPAWAPVLRALTLWSRVAITGAPSQAGTLPDLIVQGIAEEFSTSGWRITCNVTPAPPAPMIWDDPTTGFWDAGYVWAY